MGKRVTASLASLYVVIMLCVRGLQRNRCKWWDTERTHAFRAFFNCFRPPYCQADAAFEVTALELGNHPPSFKDEARVAKELYEVAGSDKKLDAKRHQH